MHLSEQDVTAIYARAWYGGKAQQVVGEQIAHLRRKGDLNGVRAWSRVAAELSKVAPAPKKKIAGAKLY